MEQSVLWGMAAAMLSITFVLGRYSARVERLEEWREETKRHHEENLERLRAIERELHSMSRG